MKQHPFSVLTMLLLQSLVSANDKSIVNMRVTNPKTSFVPFPYGLPICNLKLPNEKKEIGEGWFGKIFEITRQGDNKQFAMKTTKGNLSNEIEILARIKGLGITPDIICTSSDQSFFVMERVHGVSLADAKTDFLFKSQRLSNIVSENLKTSRATRIESKEIKRKLLLSFAIQMVSILEKLHQQNIYHCDCHEKNWMVEQDTLKVLLIDFGTGDSTNFQDPIERKKMYNVDIFNSITSLYDWSEYCLNLKEEDFSPSIKRLFAMEMNSYPTIQELLKMLKSY